MTGTEITWGLISGKSSFKASWLTASLFQRSVLLQKTSSNKMLYPAYWLWFSLPYPWHSPGTGQTYPAEFSLDDKHSGLWQFVLCTLPVMLSNNLSCVPCHLLYKTSNRNILVVLGLLGCDHLLDNYFFCIRSTVPPYQKLSMYVCIFCYVSGSNQHRCKLQTSDNVLALPVSSAWCTSNTTLANCISFQMCWVIAQPLAVRTIYLCTSIAETLTVDTSFWTHFFNGARIADTINAK